MREDEELLDGPSLPRWLPWGGGGVAAVLLIAFLAVHLGGGDPSASPTTGASDSSITAGPATLAAPADLVDDTPVNLPFADVPSDVVVAGAQTFTLVGNNLARIDRSGFSASIVENLTPELADSSSLELDAAAHLVWVVPLGVRHATVRAFDTETLAPVAKAHPAHVVGAAAALDGHLYISDGGQVLRITRTGRTTKLGRPVPQIFALAPDPTRKRLVATIDGGSNHVMLAAFYESGRSDVARAPIDLVKGQLTVAGSGEIWLAGFGFNGAILVRVDPSLRHTLAVSSLANQLGPGAEVLASGTNSLLVHSAGGDSELWCTSAQTGAVAQSWQLTPVRAASVRGRAFALSSGGLVQLSLAGHCTG